jgi:hypothetical protein
MGYGYAYGYGYKIKTPGPTTRRMSIYQNIKISVYQYISVPRYSVYKWAIRLTDCRGACARDGETRTVTEAGTYSYLISYSRSLFSSSSSSSFSIVCS